MRKPSALDPMKHVLRVFWTAQKNETFYMLIPDVSLEIFVS